MKDDEQTAAAASRSDYVQALREEREGYERTGNKGRLAAVDAEIERVSGAPINRSETPTEPPPIGLQAPADDKPKPVIHAKKG